MKIKWDKWQREVLEHDGNITLRTGRQVGKSEVISAKAVKFALANKGTTTMIIAASQRQSSLLFEKVRGRLDNLERKDKVEYAEKPTLTKIVLSNGSKIYSLPAGRTGYFIRGFTIDLLIADEAAYIPETVWTAVIPMIAVSKKARGFGWIILLSTPFGKGGYFYESFHDKDFKSFHISSEKCSRIPKNFLDKEKKRMSKMEYAQEYLGEFIDDFAQFFPTDLLKSCMNFIEWSLNKDYSHSKRYYLGVDLAGYGADENAFVISELKKNRIKIVKALTSKRKPAPDTIGRIKTLDKLYHFSRIFVDDAGLGSPITDLLKADLGRKVTGINNSKKRIIERGEEQKQGILKQDLYSNALMLMETGRIDIISNLRLLQSLKSMLFEYNSSGKLKIYGADSHLAEAFVRACWCIKDKGLKLFVF
jgi:hypothetical protein